MKSKRFSIFNLPQALVVCFGPIFAISTAWAAPLVFNENSTVNTWVTPSGTNLLAAATPTPATPTSNYGSSSSWSTLTNGSLGSPAPGANIPYTTQMNTVVMPNNGDTVVFALDLSGAHSTGYNITSVDSYGLWNDAGRDDQTYTISYSTVANPAAFTVLATVNNHTANPGNGSKSTHTNIVDSSGILAMNVAKVQITFGPGQENNNTGFSEFIVRDVPSNVAILNENRADLGWTLPAGSNLLHAASVSSGTPTSSHGATTTSATWSTLTDGQLGTIAGNLSACVSPNDGLSVIFPLDLSVNVKGYDLNSLDFYSAWADTGRDNMDFTVTYSTWDNPTVFLPLSTVVNHGPASGNSATHTQLTPVSGFLASGVAAVKVYFNGQENGWVGYREFIALGQASPLTTPITWTGNSGTGGNASWITTADSNWTPGNFDPTSPLNFTATGNNRIINIPTALTASSMTFTNSNTTPYVFSGGAITLSNGITSSTGNGVATFNGVVNATTGVTLTGGGSLVFNNDLQSPGLILSGSGSISLNADNDASLFSGTASVSNGVLNIGDDSAMIAAALSMTGGTANFTTASPYLKSLSGTAGTVVLSNTELTVGVDSVVGQTPSFAGNISQAASTTGGITKMGTSTLTLSGTNTYTGPTEVGEGLLQFSKEVSLYGGTISSWTSSNIVVDSGATLAFNVGSTGEFTDGDLIALDTGGFASGSTLGLTTTAIFTLSRSLSGDIGVFKNGSSTLTLSGTNSYTGVTNIVAGTVRAANPTGVSLPGDVSMGDTTKDAFLSMMANNQFGPNSVLHLVDGNFNGSQTKVQLRGTQQRIIGLDSPRSSRISIIQNEDTTVPDYVANPSLGTATLTIDTPASSSYSYFGIIRNQDGPALSVVKNGLGTQEFINDGIQGFGYTGPTLVNAGTLKLTFGGPNTGFSSDITIASGATLQFGSTTNYTFGRTISGDGRVVVTSPNFVILNSGTNSWTGGTTVDGGVLALTPLTATGAGNGPGQTCSAGAMIPTNVLNLINNSLMTTDNTGPLGQASVVPAWAPTVIVHEGSKINGGTNSVVFIANLTLDGGKIEISSGATTGGYNTNLCFVGTVIVGGTSTVPAQIVTTGTGATANASLGSSALVGTTFQVADVTGDSTEDLVVSSILQDVHGVASPLTKTGPGTMSASGANTYTGSTTVSGGVLSITTPYLADGAGVSIASGATLDLAFSGTDTINSLTVNGTLMAAGTYGSMANTTPGIIHTASITGTGLLLATTGAVSDPYVAWASVIPNAGDRDPSSDPDHDGFNNRLEYLFGGSPIGATGSLTSLLSGPSGVTLRWAQRASGSYVLQESSDLSTWTTSLVVPTTAADQTNLYSADYTRMEATIPLSAPKKFVRIKGTSAN